MSRLAYRFAFQGMLGQIPDALSNFRRLQRCKLRAKLTSTFLTIPKTLKGKVLGKKFARRYLNRLLHTSAPSRNGMAENVDQLLLSVTSYLAHKTRFVDHPQQWISA